MFKFTRINYKYMVTILMGDKMKKNMNKQSKTNTNITNSCKNNITDKNQDNKISNQSSQKTNKVSNSNIGFENESKSFELDDDDSHSFELR